MFFYQGRQENGRAVRNRMTVACRCVRRGEGKTPFHDRRPPRRAVPLRKRNQRIFGSMRAEVRPLVTADLFERVEPFMQKQPRRNPGDDFTGHIRQGSESAFENQRSCAVDRGEVDRDRASERTSHHYYLGFGDVFPHRQPKYVFERRDL